MNETTVKTPIKKKIIVKKTSVNGESESKPMAKSNGVKSGTLNPKPKPKPKLNDEKFNFKKYFGYAISEFKRFQDIKGQTGKVEALSYLGFYIASIVLLISFTILLNSIGLGSIARKFMSLIQLVLLVPGVGVFIRRLNDMKINK